MLLNILKYLHDLIDTWEITYIFMNHLKTALKIISEKNQMPWHTNKAMYYLE